MSGRSASPGRVTARNTDDDVAHELILQREDVVEPAVDLDDAGDACGSRASRTVAVTRTCVPGALKPAAHEPPRAQLARDALRQRLVARRALPRASMRISSWTRARGTRDVPGQLTEVGRQRLRQPGAEPVIVRVAGDVDERADRQSRRASGLARRASPRREPPR